MRGVGARLREEQLVGVKVALEAVRQQPEASAAAGPKVLREVGGVELAPVDEGEREAVGDGGTEGLEQIQGERGTAVVGLMQEAEVGFQAGAFQQGADLAQQQGVAEAEQDVEGVARRPAVAAVEGEAAAVERGEGLPVGAGGGAFHAEKGGLVGGLGGGVDAAGLGFDGAGQQGGGVVGAEVGEQRGGVAQLGLHEGLRQGEGLIGVGGGPVLGETEVDVAGLGGDEMALDTAVAGVEGEADAALEQLGEGLGGDLDGAEDGDGVGFAEADLGQALVVLFDEQAAAALADDGALLADVDDAHGGSMPQEGGWVKGERACPAFRARSVLGQRGPGTTLPTSNDSKGSLTSQSLLSQRGSRDDSLEVMGLVLLMVSIAS